MRPTRPSALATALCIALLAPSSHAADPLPTLPLTHETVGNATAALDGQGFLSITDMRSTNDRIRFHPGDPSDPDTGSLSGVGPVRIDGSTSGANVAYIGVRATARQGSGFPSDVIEGGFEFDDRGGGPYEMTTTLALIEGARTTVSRNGLTAGKADWTGLAILHQVGALPTTAAALGGALSSTFNCIATEVDRASGDSSTSSSCGDAPTSSTNSVDPRSPRDLSGADAGGLTFVFTWDTPTSVHIEPASGPPIDAMIDRMEITVDTRVEVFEWMDVSYASVSQDQTPFVPTYTVSAARIAAFDKVFDVAPGTTVRSTIDPATGGEILTFDSSASPTGIGAFSTNLRGIDREDVRLAFDANLGAPELPIGRWIEVQGAIEDVLGESHRAGLRVANSANPGDRLTTFYDFFEAESRWIFWHDGNVVADYADQIDQQVAFSQSFGEVVIMFRKDTGESTSQGDIIGFIIEPTAPSSYYEPGDPTPYPFDRLEVLIDVDAPAPDTTPGIDMRFSTGQPMVVEAALVEYIVLVGVVGIDVAPLPGARKGISPFTGEKQVIHARNVPAFATRAEPLGFVQHFDPPVKEIWGSWLTAAEDGPALPAAVGLALATIDWYEISGGVGEFVGDTLVRIDQIGGDFVVAGSNTLAGATSHALSLYRNGARILLLEEPDAAAIVNMTLPFLPNEDASLIGTSATQRPDGTITFTKEWESSTPLARRADGPLYKVVYEVFGLRNDLKIGETSTALHGLSELIAQVASGPTAVSAPVPTATSIDLLPATPNPFNPRTSLQFVTTRPGPALLTIHNARGRRVATLVDSILGAGAHTTVWAGTDDAGERVASGLYLLRLASGGETVTQKLTLLK